MAKCVKNKNLKRKMFIELKHITGGWGRVVPWRMRMVSSEGQGKDFLKILSTSDLAFFSELKTGKGGVDGVMGDKIL